MSSNSITGRLRPRSPSRRSRNQPALRETQGGSPQLDSTRLITTTAGVVADTYTYDVYGNTTTHTGTTNTNLQYNGQFQDSETGYYYLRARYYDPATGQFTSLDPAFTITRDRYMYARGEPLDNTDPTGLFSWSDAYTWGTIHLNPMYPVLVAYGREYDDIQAGCPTTVVLRDSAMAVGTFALAGLSVFGGFAEAAPAAESGGAVARWRAWWRGKAAAADDTGAIGSSAGRLTNGQMTDLAKRLGYRPTGRISRGQMVFTNGKTYITQDVDAHSGGVFKMAKTVEDLASKATRMGTYDHDLNYIGP